MRHYTRQYPELQKSANAAKENAEAAKRMVEEMRKGGTDTHQLAVAANEQAGNTKEALRQSDQAFRASERPYIVFGRKDGIFAEFKNGNGGQPGIVLYLQNAGRLPAVSVCVSTTVFPDPSIGRQFSQGNTLARYREKKTGYQKLSVISSPCPSIAGGAEYMHTIPTHLTQTDVDLIKNDKKLSFVFAATAQYCNSFGEYSCRQAWFDYEREPFSRIRQTSEDDCSNLYRGWPAMPAISANEEFLYPCAQPKEEEQRQKEMMRVGGWKPLTPK